MCLVNGEVEEEEEEVAVAMVEVEGGGGEEEEEGNTGRLILALLESAFAAGAATMLIHLSSDSCCLPLCCMFVDTFSVIFCTLPFAGLVLTLARFLELRN